MKLADLKASVRRDKLLEAVNDVLRQADGAISTGQLVKRVCALLKAEENSTWVAKELQKTTAKGHPMRRPTGEVFRRYGREMPRYEWLPSHRKGNRSAVPPDVQAALDERRARIAQLEAVSDPVTPAVDEWEWTPPVDEDGFLED